ncbi:accessory gene regulator B family protein [Clostridium sp. MSJ-4]|uniref:Accessory gene regulator B family protein n=1 Tax=Clostridium simiarum TaxID=2841506 RepID=A0ABS6EYB3_9CLOT|nr:accessory gene regulator B family protein [Clostridium simiarum]MBU5591223.1 accessory gene regulator B family protein [Clostridium simiarum]
MINKLACKITYYIENNSDIKSISDLEKITYSLQAIFNELFKTVILIAIFFIIGKLDYFLFSMMILFSIRIFAGGYHCSTTISCLFFSILFFLPTSLLSGFLPKLNMVFYYVIALLSILVILFRSPYPNKKRPIKSKKRRQILKFLSIFFTISWLCILLLYIKDISYLNCGFSTILLEVSQLIPKKKGVF